MLFQHGYLPIKKTKHHLSCFSKDITPSPISGNEIPKGAKFHLAWYPRKPQKFFTRRSFPNDCLQFLPQSSIAVCSVFSIYIKSSWRDKCHLGKQNFSLVLCHVDFVS